MALPWMKTALAVLLVSSVVMALSADEAARFYLKSGETMKLETVSFGGTTYSLVKIDGNPSLVLAPSGDSFEALTERTQLEPVVKAYSQEMYEAKDFKKSAALINESLPLFESVLGSCDQGGAIFTTNFPRRTVRLGKANVGLKYLIDNTQAYKSEKEGYIAFNASYPQFHEAYQAFMPQAQAFGGLVAAGDSDGVLNAAFAIRLSAGTLKKSFDEVSSAYRILSSSKELGGILNFTFYEEGSPRRCNADVNTTTALTRIENEFSDLSLRSSSSLLETILAFSESRQSEASKGTAYAVSKEKVASAEKSIDNVTTRFAGTAYPVELKALLAKKQALKASLDAVNETGKTDAVDSAIQEINSLVPAYASIVGPFKNATERIKKATENVTAAQKKYGDTDARVQALNKELTGLKANMTAGLTLLSSGDVAKASAQFAAVSQQASDLAFRAGSLPPQGNDLNLPIIAGVVVLLIILGVTVWYFRRMKQQQPKLGTD